MSPGRLCPAVPRPSISQRTDTFSSIRGPETSLSNRFQTLGVNEDCVYPGWRCSSTTSDTGSRYRLQSDVTSSVSGETAINYSSNVFRLTNAPVKESIDIEIGDDNLVLISVNTTGQTEQGNGETFRNYVEDTEEEEVEEEEEEEEQIKEPDDVVYSPNIKEEDQQSYSGSIDENNATGEESASDTGSHYFYPIRRQAVSQESKFHNSTEVEDRGGGGEEEKQRLKLNSEKTPSIKYPFDSGDKSSKLLHGNSASENEIDKSTCSTIKRELKINPQTFITGTVNIVPMKISLADQIKFHHLKGDLSGRTDVHEDAGSSKEVEVIKAFTPAASRKSSTDGICYSSSSSACGEPLNKLWSSLPNSGSSTGMSRPKSPCSSTRTSQIDEDADEEDGKKDSRSSCVRSPSKGPSSSTKTFRINEDANEEHGEKDSGGDSQEEDEDKEDRRKFSKISNTSCKRGRDRGGIIQGEDDKEDRRKSSRVSPTSSKRGRDCGGIIQGEVDDKENRRKSSRVSTTCSKKGMEIQTTDTNATSSLPCAPEGRNSALTSNLLFGPTIDDAILNTLGIMSILGFRHNLCCISRSPLKEGKKKKDTWCNEIVKVTAQWCCDDESCRGCLPQDFIRDALGPTLDEVLIESITCVRSIFGSNEDDDVDECDEFGRLLCCNLKKCESGKPKCLQQRLEDQPSYSGCNKRSEDKPSCSGSDCNKRSEDQSSCTCCKKNQQRTKENESGSDSAGSNPSTRSSADIINWLKQEYSSLTEDQQRASVTNDPNSGPLSQTAMSQRKHILDCLSTLLEKKISIEKQKNMDTGSRRNMCGITSRKASSVTSIRPIGDSHSREDLHDDVPEEEIGSRRSSRGSRADRSLVGQPGYLNPPVIHQDPNEGTELDQGQLPLFGNQFAEPLETHSTRIANKDNMTSSRSASSQHSTSTEHIPNSISNTFYNYNSRRQSSTLPTNDSYTTISSSTNNTLKVNGCSSTLQKNIKRQRHSQYSELSNYSKYDKNYTLSETSSYSSSSKSKPNTMIAKKIQRSEDKAVRRSWRSPATSRSVSREYQINCLQGFPHGIAVKCRRGKSPRLSVGKKTLSYRPRQISSQFLVAKRSSLRKSNTRPTRSPMRGKCPNTTTEIYKSSSQEFSVDVISLTQEYSEMSSSVAGLTLSPDGMSSKRLQNESEDITLQYTHIYRPKLSQNEPNVDPKQHCTKSKNFITLNPDQYQKSTSRKLKHDSEFRYIKYWKEPCRRYSTGRRLYTGYRSRATIAKASLRHKRRSRSRSAGDISGNSSMASPQYSVVRMRPQLLRRITLNRTQATTEGTENKTDTTIRRKRHSKRACSKSESYISKTSCELEPELKLYRESHGCKRKSQYRVRSRMFKYEETPSKKERSKLDRHAYERRCIHPDKVTRNDLKFGRVKRYYRGFCVPYSPITKSTREYRERHSKWTANNIEHSFKGKYMVSEATQTLTETNNSKRKMDVLFNTQNRDKIQNDSHHIPYGDLRSMSESTDAECTIISNKAPPRSLISEKQLVYITHKSKGTQISQHISSEYVPISVSRGTQTVLETSRPSTRKASNSLKHSDTKTLHPDKFLTAKPYMLSRDTQTSQKNVSTRSLHNSREKLLPRSHLDSCVQTSAIVTDNMSATTPLRVSIWSQTNDASIHKLKLKSPLKYAHEILEYNDSMIDTASLEKYNNFQDNYSSNLFNNEFQKSKVFQSVIAAPVFTRNSNPLAKGMDPMWGMSLLETSKKDNYVDMQNSQKGKSAEETKYSQESVRLLQTERHHSHTVSTRSSHYSECRSEVQQRSLNTDTASEENANEKLLAHSISSINFSASNEVCSTKETKKRPKSFVEEIELTDTRFDSSERLVIESIASSNSFHGTMSDAGNKLSRETVSILESRSRSSTKNNRVRHVEDTRIEGIQSNHTKTQTIVKSTQTTESQVTMPRGNDNAWNERTKKYLDEIMLPQGRFVELGPHKDHVKTTTDSLFPSRCILPHTNEKSSSTKFTTKEKDMIVSSPESLQHMLELAHLLGIEYNTLGKIIQEASKHNKASDILPRSGDGIDRTLYNLREGLPSNITQSQKCKGSRVSKVTTPLLSHSDTETVRLNQDSKDRRTRSFTNQWDDGFVRRHRISKNSLEYNLLEYNNCNEDKFITSNYTSPSKNYDYKYDETHPHDNVFSNNYSSSHENPSQRNRSFKNISQPIPHHFNTTSINHALWFNVSTNVGVKSSVSNSKSIETVNRRTRSMEAERSNNNIRPSRNKNSPNPISKNPVGLIPVKSKNSANYNPKYNTHNKINRVNSRNESSLESQSSMNNDAILDTKVSKNKILLPQSIHSVIKMAYSSDNLPENDNIPKKEKCSRNILGSGTPRKEHLVTFSKPNEKSTDSSTRDLSLKNSSTNLTIRSSERSVTVNIIQSNDDLTKIPSTPTANRFTKTYRAQFHSNLSAVSSTSCREIGGEFSRSPSQIVSSNSLRSRTHSESPLTNHSLPSYERTGRNVRTTPCSKSSSCRVPTSSGSDERIIAENSSPELDCRSQSIKEVSIDVVETYPPKVSRKPRSTPHKRNAKTIRTPLDSENTKSCESSASENITEHKSAKKISTHPNSNHSEYYSNNISQRHTSKTPEESRSPSKEIETGSSREHLPTKVSECYILSSCERDASNIRKSGPSRNTKLLKSTSKNISTTNDKTSSNSKTCKLPTSPCHEYSESISLQNIPSNLSTNYTSPANEISLLEIQEVSPPKSSKQPKSREHDPKRTQQRRTSKSSTCSTSPSDGVATKYNKKYSQNYKSKHLKPPSSDYNSNESKHRNRSRSSTHSKHLSNEIATENIQENAPLVPSHYRRSSSHEHNEENKRRGHSSRTTAYSRLQSGEKVSKHSLVISHSNISTECISPSDKKNKRDIQETSPSKSFVCERSLSHEHDSNKKRKREPSNIPSHPKSPSHRIVNTKNQQPLPSRSAAYSRSPTDKHETKGSRPYCSKSVANSRSPSGEHNKTKIHQPSNIKTSTNPSVNNQNATKVPPNESPGKSSSNAVCKSGKNATIKSSYGQKVTKVHENHQADNNSTNRKSSSKNMESTYSRPPPPENNSRKDPSLLRQKSLKVEHKLSSKQQPRGNTQNNFTDDVKNSAKSYISKSTHLSPPYYNSNANKLTGSLSPNNNPQKRAPYSRRNSLSVSPSASKINSLANVISCNYQISIRNGQQRTPFNKSALVSAYAQSGMENSRGYSPTNSLSRANKEMVYNRSPSPPINRKKESTAHSRQIDTKNRKSSSPKDTPVKLKSSSVQDALKHNRTIPPSRSSVDPKQSSAQSETSRRTSPHGNIKNIQSSYSQKVARSSQKASSIKLKLKPKSPNKRVVTKTQDLNSSGIFEENSGGEFREPIKRISRFDSRINTSTIVETPSKDELSLHNEVPSRKNILKDSQSSFRDSSPTHLGEDIRRSSDYYIGTNETQYGSHRSNLMLSNSRNHLDNSTTRVTDDESEKSINGDSKSRSPTSVSQQSTSVINTTDDDKMSPPKRKFNSKIKTILKRRVSSDLNTQKSVEVDSISTDLIVVCPNSKSSINIADSITSNPFLSSRQSISMYVATTSSKHSLGSGEEKITVSNTDDNVGDSAYSVLHIQEDDIPNEETGESDTASQIRKSNISLEATDSSVPQTNSDNQSLTDEEPKNSVRTGKRNDQSPCTNSKNVTLNKEIKGDSEKNPCKEIESTQWKSPLCCASSSEESQDSDEELVPCQCTTLKEQKKGMQLPKCCAHLIDTSKSGPGGKYQLDEFDEVPKWRDPRLFDCIRKKPTVCDPCTCDTTTSLQKKTKPKKKFLKYGSLDVDEEISREIVCCSNKNVPKDSLQLSRSATIRNNAPEAKHRDVEECVEECEKEMHEEIPGQLTSEFSNEDRSHAEGEIISDSNISRKTEFSNEDASPENVVAPREPTKISYEDIGPEDVHSYNVASPRASVRFTDADIGPEDVFSDNVVTPKGSEGISDADIGPEDVRSDNVVTPKGSEGISDADIGPEDVRSDNVASPRGSVEMSDADIRSEDVRSDNVVTPKGSEGISDADIGPEDIRSEDVANPEGLDLKLIDADIAIEYVNAFGVGYLLGGVIEHQSLTTLEIESPAKEEINKDIVCPARSKNNEFSYNPSTKDNESKCNYFPVSESASKEESPEEYVRIGDQKMNNETGLLDETIRKCGYYGKGVPNNECIGQSMAGDKESAPGELSSKPHSVEFAKSSGGKFCKSKACKVNKKPTGQEQQSRPDNGYKSRATNAEKTSSCPAEIRVKPTEKQKPIKLCSKEWKRSQMYAGCLPPSPSFLKPPSLWMNKKYPKCKGGTYMVEFKPDSNEPSSPCNTPTETLSNKQLVNPTNKKKRKDLNKKLIQQLEESDKKSKDEYILTNRYLEIRPCTCGVDSNYCKKHNKEKSKSMDRNEFNKPTEKRNARKPPTSGSEKIEDRGGITNPEEKVEIACKDVTVGECPCRAVNEICKCHPGTAKTIDSKPATGTTTENRKSDNFKQPTQVLWAVTRINVFGDNSRTYEVMKPTNKEPKNIPKYSEGIFATSPM